MSDLVDKLLEQIQKPAFIKNERGIYIGCNATFEKFLGLSRRRIIGHTAFEIAPVALAQTYTDADLALFARRSVQIYQAPVARANQQQEAVIFTKTIFFDDDDQLAGFIGVINVMAQQAALKSSSQPAAEGNQAPAILTKREFEVLHLLAQGLSTKAIAITLGLSTNTTADYMKSIYLKLDVHSRMAAIIAAQKLRLI